MSLERVNVNVKLDPDMHSLLKGVAQIMDKGLGETIEALVVPILLQRLHEARLLCTAVPCQSAPVDGRQCLSEGVNGRQDQSKSVNAGQ